MDKPTLLDITQDILNDISGDEVNSIDDTVESVQVAAIIRSTYRNLMASRDWPHTRRLLQLIASGDTSLPVYMTMDPSVKKVISISYDKSKSLDNSEYGEVKYITPENFLRLSNNRGTNNPNIIAVTDPISQVSYYIDIMNAPTYYTSFDDVTLVFDSYDSNIEDTLQTSRSQAYVYMIPDWVHTDEAIPDLPVEAFTQLIEDAKSACALKLRQQADQKAEAAAQTAKRWNARESWTMGGGIKFYNYGRAGKGRSANRRDPTFRRDDK